MRARKLIPLAVVLMGLLYGASCARRVAETEPAAPPPAAEPGKQPRADAIPAWKDPVEKSVASDQYYGVYMMEGQKVGWQRVRRATVEWQGAEAQYYLSEMRLILVTLGSRVDQRVEQKLIVSADGLPLRGHYEMPQGVIDAVFGPEEVRYERSAAGSVRSGALPIPAEANLRDPEISGAPEAATVGFRAEYLTFEPITVQLVPATYEIQAKESLEALGARRECYRTLSRLGTGTQLVSWVDAKSHELVRMTSQAGKLEMRLEEKEVAQRLPETAPDLATETRIAVNTPIAAPERQKQLKLRVLRVPSRAQLVSDGRQAWSDIVEEKGVLGATVTVRAQETPRQGVPAVDGQEAFRRPSPHIESDDERIVARARELAPEGADPVRAAEAIGRWVHERMRSDTQVGGMRSALEVLEDPRGVCRDYAVLYAALARAAGIPTKFCAGCVYWNRANAPGFYYHAWNEVYLPTAEGGAWIAIDTTRADPWPVDATHLKFAEGDYGCMLDVVGLIGQLKIEVL